MARLTEGEIEDLRQAALAALPNQALVAAIVDDLIPAIESIVTDREAAAAAHAQWYERVVGKVEEGK